MSSNSLIKGSFWLILATSLERGGLVLASIIASNSIGVNEFSDYSFFQLTMGTLAVLLSAGISVVATKSFAREKFKESYTSELWFLSLIVAFVSLFILYLIPFDLLSEYTCYSQWLLPVAVFLIIMNIVPNGAAIGLEKFKQLAFVSTISFSVLLTGALISYYYSSVLGAVNSLLLYLLVQTTGNTLFLLLHKKLPFFIKSIRLTVVSVKYIWSEIAPMIVVSMVFATSGWLIGSMILLNSGKYDFSLYSIGFQWYALVLFLPGVLSKVFFPIFIKKIVSGESSQSIKETLKVVVYVSLSIALFIGVLSLIGSPFIIKLYGDNYYNESWLVALYAMAALPLSIVNTLNNLLVASGLQKKVSYNSVVWFLFLMSVSFLLSGKGVYGAGFSLLLSSVLMLFLSALSIKNHVLTKG